MAKTCPTCRQAVPAVAHCKCNHSRAEHAIRERRKVLTRAQCFVQDCPCQRYEPLEER